MKKCNQIIFAGLIFLVAFCSALANDAPVVDVTQDIAQHNVQGQVVAQAQPQMQSQALSSAQGSSQLQDDSDTQDNSLTETQRIFKLEQQMRNLIQMNLPQQISDIQQKLQQISGELEVQAHDVKLLSSQQRAFYQDLDQRIKSLKKTSDAQTNVASTSGASMPIKVVANGAALEDTSTYQAAFALLTKKQYPQAQQAFQNYLATFPNGNYVVNAHYWLGEIYLQQKNISSALIQFQTLVNKYPKSAKIADAKLKIAIIHEAQGNKSLARKEFMQIKKQYSGSTAAQLASLQLQQLAIDDNN